jgi:predicted NACHT family NTPase
MKNIPWLIIFDGLDEVIDHDHRSITFEMLTQFYLLSKPKFANTRVIITSRPDRDCRELNEVGRHIELTMTNLTETHVRKYIQVLLNNYVMEIDRERIRELWDLCLQNENYTPLLISPLSLLIVTIILSTKGISVNNKAKLYQEYYDTIFLRETNYRISGIKDMLDDFKEIILKLHYIVGYNILYQTEDNLCQPHPMTFN